MTSSTNLPHHSVKNIGNQSPFTSKPLRICVNPFCRLSALRSERFCPLHRQAPQMGQLTNLPQSLCHWWTPMLLVKRIAVTNKAYSKDFEVHPFCLTNWPYNSYLLGSCSFSMPFVLASELALDAGSTSAASCFRSADGGNSLQQAGNPSPNPGSPSPPTFHPKALGRWIPLTYRNSSSLRTCQKHQIHRNSIKFLENSKFVTKPIGISMLPQYHSSFLAHGS